MSSTRLSYTTLDVFTYTPFEGNPLAVVNVPSSVALSQSQKQTIAREFNYSETVFLHESATMGERRIDIFTTTAELPFAGHPIIGTASLLLGDSKDPVSTLITKAGRVPIGRANPSSAPGPAQAFAGIPHNLHVHAERWSSAQLLEIQPALAKHRDDLMESFQVVSIVKGMTFILVQLPSMDALSAVSTVAGKPSVALDKDWDESFVGTYYFVGTDSSKPASKAVACRMIDGLLEDPATGSAACTLASYLALSEGKGGGEVDGNIVVDIVQGEQMGRRSEIGVEVAMGKGPQISTVTLQGRAVKIMEGQMLVPTSH